MNSGVSRICRQSDVVDQIAGTRTLPSPRSTLSSMPPVKVMMQPPKITSTEHDGVLEHVALPPIQPSSVRAEQDHHREGDADHEREQGTRAPPPTSRRRRGVRR